MNEEKEEIVESKASIPIQSLDIKNLIVSPMPLRRLVLGEVKDIVDITERKKKKGVRLVKPRLKRPKMKKVDR